MFDADPNVRATEIDLAFLEHQLAGMEPAAPRRSAGDVFESPMMGRLQFVPMPLGRPSIWRGEQKMPDNRFPLQIVCEVEGDQEPGADQAACVTAFRRLQVQDAMQCAPLINARLAELPDGRTIAADDLVLTMVHLPPHPLTDASYELGFRAGSRPNLMFTVVFQRGVPRSVRIDSDS